MFVVKLGIVGPQPCTEMKADHFMVPLTVIGEHWSRQQVLQDPAVLFKRTLHLLPGHELAHLLGQLPELLQHRNTTRVALIRSELLKQAAALPCPWMQM